MRLGATSPSGVAPIRQRGSSCPSRMGRRASCTVLSRSQSQHSVLVCPCSCARARARVWVRVRRCCVWPQTHGGQKGVNKTLKLIGQIAALAPLALVPRPPPSLAIAHILRGAPMVPITLCGYRPSRTLRRSRDGQEPAAGLRAARQGADLAVPLPLPHRRQQPPSGPQSLCLGVALPQALGAGAGRPAGGAAWVEAEQQPR